ncbi:probable tRNA-splicing endonuclease subunit Sen2 [Typha latifolia]|uniref:probable tRNA-splicing endonuclease subunit Sen2 n=1 Tax=Typha latifolia TaxID=4733 RepID=UPI003C2B65E7
MELMTPRWKGKGSAAIAEANPMSQIILQLQSMLVQQETHAILCDFAALLGAGPDAADLLNRACFGRQINTYSNNKQWFQLGMEEVFYMAHQLQCLKVVRENDQPMNDPELWKYIASKNPAFPEHYKAYAHLRRKNWVMRPGTQYGVDFVAYRHHPALVHSEYAVIVVAEGNGNQNGARLNIWSDVQCSVRVCGSVAKTLLEISVNRNGCEASFPSCLEKFTVEERVITRWLPEQCRDG